MLDSNRLFLFHISLDVGCAFECNAILFSTGSLAQCNDDDKVDAMSYKMKHARPFLLEH